MKVLKDKILVVLSIFIILVSFAGCSQSSNSQETKKSPTKIMTKLKGKSQDQLNQELKNQSVQANFVEINGHTSELKNKKVFAVGKISVVDYQGAMDVFPSFILSQKESNGFGMYHITNVLSVKGLKDGDNVKIYGTIDGTAKDSMPKIIATVIEKQ